MKEISAGAIVYTKIEDRIYYLLIRDFHGNVGFPKGHLEPGETRQMAALREIREETGLNTDLDDCFEEELNYTMPNGIDKCSVYFVAYFENQEPVKQVEEVDEIYLLPYEETLDRLTFENMRDVFVKAHKYITERLNGVIDG